MNDLLPHAAPFRWIDRMTACEAGSAATAEKMVSSGDFWLRGSPGGRLAEMFLLEGCAQTAGLAGGDGLRFVAQVEDFRFALPVRPGDRVMYEARVDRRIGRLCRVAVTAQVEGRTVAGGFIVLAEAAP